MVKYLVWMVVAVFFEATAFGQQPASLTLDQAYREAVAHYPVTRQSRLVEQTATLSIENLSKGYLPQLSVSAQATYQSDVTKVDIPFPGLTIDPLSKDQYKLVADVSQLLWDGGVIRRQKEIQQQQAGVEEEKVQVELYRLRERINQLFLGVLYLDEQLKQTELVKSDLLTGVKRVEAQVMNGIAFRSNLNVLKAESLRADQRVVELKASRKGLLQTLSLFIGRELSESISLSMPTSVTFQSSDAVLRPELKLYDQQKLLLQRQQELVNAKNLPKASLFLQSGYGRPGLNMLKNEFDFFYIGGLRLNWSLASLYTKRKEKELVEISRKVIDIQKETFLLNTGGQLRQQASEVEKLQQLVASDQEIIDLRLQVKEAASAQLENGVITANDYLREVNAEDQARQTLITHRLQLLQAQINYQTISGSISKQ